MMKQHFLSAIVIVAMVLLGSATTMAPSIEADVRRTPDSLLITNKNDFDWEQATVRVEVWGIGRWYEARADIGAVVAGEPREVRRSEFTGEANIDRLFEPDRIARLHIDLANRYAHMYEPLRLSDLPSAE